MRICICLYSILLAGIFISPIQAQNSRDSLLYSAATLDTCVKYAIQHQPVIQQALIDEEITERMIKGKLADWFPQINFNINALHYFDLPTIIFQGAPTKSGVTNTHVASFSLTQNIFNRDVLLASRSANDLRRQSSQNTSENKIDIAVNVGKAYYDVLLTQKQIQLLDEDIVRLSQSVKDSYNQYQGGIVDKTDYKRATISLNNSKAQKRTNEELLKGKYAYLKQLMGYPPQGDLQLMYDSLKMEREAAIDTNQSINYESRIEYQLLLTQQKLQEDNLKYYKWAYIPSISAVGNYSLNYQSNDFSNLYSQNYPSSYAGIQLAFPIFQGTKRTQEIRQAELQLKRVDYDIINLKNTVSTEYTQALASYKSNLNEYNVLKENLELARDVYNTIQLQYRSGIKTYLEVITAESDLRTAQVNYTNALFEVLISKLDVQKALGLIRY